jgi:hypothetical protein
MLAIVQKVAAQPHEWTDERGAFCLERVAGDVVRVDVRGYLSEELGQALGDALTRQFASSEPLHCFFDGEAVDAYHSYVRVGLTAVLLNNLSRVASISVLARSSLVHMGIAVANLALQGRIKPFGERSAFEQEFARRTGGASQPRSSGQRSG